MGVFSRGVLCVLFGRRRRMGGCRVLDGGLWTFYRHVREAPSGEDGFCGCISTLMWLIPGVESCKDQ